MKNRKIILLSLILVLSGLSELRAAFEPKGHGCRYLAAGSSGIAGERTDFALFINPARLALMNDRIVNAFYRNFYSIKGLDQFSLSLGMRLFNWPLAVGASRFGNKLYTESEYRLGTALRLNESFILGLSLNAYALEITRYGQAMTWGFDLGAVYDLQDNFSAAFTISNLNEPEIGESAESLPSNFSLGFAFSPVPEINLTFDVVKDMDFDFDYRLGVNYAWLDWLQLMSGFRENVNTFCGGFFLQRGPIRVSYAIEYHRQLGSSHAFGIGYDF